MSETKRLSKELFIYVLGEFFSKSLTFLLLPIYAYYFSVDEFATLSLISIIWPLLIIIFGSGFSTFILRGYYDYNEKKGEFFFTILFLSILLALLFAGIIHFTGEHLVRLIFNNLSYKPLLQYSVLFALFRLYFNHILAFFRAERRPIIVVTLSFLIFLSISLTTLYMAIIEKSSLESLLKAQAITYFFNVILFSVVIKPHIEFKINLNIFKSSLFFVIPLLPHALSSWVVPYISRVFIQRSLPAYDLSLYHIAAQIALVLGVLNSGLNQSWIPFVYSNYQKPNFKKLFKVGAQRYLVFSFICALCIIFGCKELLLLIGKAEYFSAVKIVPILVIAYIFQAVYFLHTPLLLYHKKTNVFPIISISSGTICVLLNILLLPVLNVYGAALATLISFVLMAKLASVFSRKLIIIDFVERSFITFLILVIVVGSFYLVITNYWNLFYRLVYIIVTFSLLIVYLMKGTLVFGQNKIFTFKKIL